MNARRASLSYRAERNQVHAFPRGRPHPTDRRRDNHPVPSINAHEA